MARRLFRSFVVLFVVSTVGIAFGGLGTAADPRWNATPLTTDTPVVTGFKARSAKLAKTDPSLLGITSNKKINVVVKFDYDSVAAYVGGVKGYAPTSPEATGKSLRRNIRAVNKYLRYLAGREAEIISGIKARIPTAEVMRSLQLAYGGVSMRIPGDRVKALLSVSGVAAVQRNEVNKPLTDNSPHFIGADEAWAELGQGEFSGQDVVIGTLDTGIYPEHPSYDDTGMPAWGGGPYGCEFGDGSDPELGDPFNCNDKLVGAYAFTDTYMTFNDALPGEFCNNDTGECSARDADGHGTHTSSTSGGRHRDSAVVFGIDRGPIDGIAPGARVIMYRVCLTNGCYEDDSVAAVGQAIMDDVDVVNFSISGGEDAFSDPVELAFLDAYAADILVNASAGNAGPGAATANHAGPWTNTVGASTQDRAFESTLHLEGDGDSLNLVGVTITDGAATNPVILAQDVSGYTGGSLCLEPFDPGSVDGFIVACERGTNARVEKGYNVMLGGGEAFILYNTAVTDVETDNHWIPAIHLNIAEGAAFLDFYDSHGGDVTGSWPTGVASPAPGDVMASFSSRGPLGDFLKPDVTSVGVQVLAGHSPQHIDIVGGPPGEIFQAIAGTSMSSPHSAGSSALVKQGNLGWSPGQIKSALMTTASTDVVKEDFVTPATPFDMGAGSIRPNRALDAGLTFDVAAADYYAAADDPLGRIHLNLPSINAPVMPGRVTTTRTGVNVSGQTLSYEVDVTNPEPGRISVTPSTFTVGPGESVTLTITIGGAQLDDGQYFGEIRLNVTGGDTNDLHLPVAFNKTAASVTLTNSCDSTTIGVGESTDCSSTVTNNSAGDATVSVKIRSSEADVVSLSGDLSFDGTLSAAQPPTVDGVVDGGTGSGYVSLASLGVPPNPDMGDEGGLNFDVPEYLYGSEPYTTLFMTANGYGKAGEGTSEDIDFVPQDLPDPVAPNNVLGPFWTDLNQEAGGETYAAILTDGTTDWIVLEWENVPTFDNNSEQQTFQIWIELGNEAISFEYGDTEGDGDGVGLTVGAENRDGSSGAEYGGGIPDAGDELSVLTSPPAGGGSVTLEYTATGELPGTSLVRAIMSADVIVGEVVKGVEITVTV
jgi:hypothetical protein